MPKSFAIIKPFNIAIDPIAIGAIKLVANQTKKRYIKTEERTADPIMVVETETTLIAEIYIAAEYSDIVAPKDKADKGDPETIIMPYIVEQGISSVIEQSFFNSQEYQDIISSYEESLSEKKEQLLSIKGRKPKLVELTEEVERLQKILVKIKSSPNKLIGFLQNIDAINSQKAYMIPAQTTFTPSVDEEETSNYSTNPMENKINELNREIAKITGFYDSRISLFNYILENMQKESESVPVSSVTINNQTFTIESVLSKIIG